VVVDVAQGRFFVSFGVAQFQVGQVCFKGCIQVKFALLNQPHGRCRVKGFADRGDLKKGLVVHREGMVDVGDAKPGGIFDAFVEDPDRRPRHAQPFEGFGHDLAQFGKFCVSYSLRSSHISLQFKRS